MPISFDQFVGLLSNSGLMSSGDIEAFQSHLDSDQQSEAEHLANHLVAQRRLTPYQASILLKGRSRGLVLGNYVILEKIGQGGMGVVFKARHQRMDRIVALKILPPSWTKSEGTVKRFHQEVKAAARLTHPNIVTAYDADEADGVHFLVMEHVEGRELSDVVEQEGPLPVPLAIHYLLQAAYGLGYAHEQGIVHRDIKPSNLLAATDHQVKILDMGLARLNGNTENSPATNGAAGHSKPGITQAGKVFGTLDYMAPEQAQDARNADHRSDIYSLGCTLYYLLTGQVPFPGETNRQKVNAHRNQPAPSLHGARNEVPPQLESLFQRMVAKKPADRCESMSEVIDILESIANELANCQVPVNPTVAGPNPRKERMATEGLASTSGATHETKLDPTEPINSRISDPVRSPMDSIRVIRMASIAGGIAAIVCTITAWWLIHPPRATQSETLLAAQSADPDVIKPSSKPTGQSHSVVAFPRDTATATNDGSEAASLIESTITRENASGVTGPDSPTNLAEAIAEQPPSAGTARESTAQHEAAARRETIQVSNSPQEEVATDEQPQNGKAAAPAEQEDYPDAPQGPDPTYLPAQPASGATRQQFEKEIRDLLDSGWGSKQSGLDSANLHFQNAASLCPNDPRAAYALGIVLLKHNKYDDALKQFDSVGEHAGKTFLPADRAAIWLRVLRKNYEPATLDLVKFTRKWRQIEPDPLPDWVQSGLVNWTGRLVGYLDGPVDSRSVDALLEKCVGEICANFTRDHRELFETARNDLLDEFAEKATAQDRSRMEAKKQQQKAADDTKISLAFEEAENKLDKEQVEKDSEDLEKSLKEQLHAIDLRIEALLRDKDRLDTQMWKLSNAIHFLDQELVSLRTERNQLQTEQNTPRNPPPNDPGKSGTPKTPPKSSNNNSSNNSAQSLFLSSAIDQKNRERIRYQADYDRLDLQLREIQRQGQALTNRRQSLINEYQTKTGKLYKEKESIAAKAKFLERKKRAASKPASGATTQVNVLGQTAKALRTYVDLNLELEKQQVLDSFEGP